MSQPLAPTVAGERPQADAAAEPVSADLPAADLPVVAQLHGKYDQYDVYGNPAEHAPSDDPAGARLTEAPVIRRSWRLMWRALLLDQRPYAAAARSHKPLQTGFMALVLLLVIFAVARAVGLGIGMLTSPRLGSLQEIVRNFIVGLPWYAAQVQQSPAFAGQFAQSYSLAWDGLRAALGIPTPTSVLVSIAVTALSTLSAWLAYGVLAHGMARWFGGQGTWRQTLGASALSYAPLLLFVVEIVPGALTPLTLVFLLMLVGKYLALKTVHDLTPGYTLAATLLPYLIGLVLLIGVALFGAAIGLERVPYLQNIVDALRSLGPLWPFGR